MHKHINRVTQANRNTLTLACRRTQTVIWMMKMQTQERRDGGEMRWVGTVIAHGSLLWLDMHGYWKKYTHIDNHTYTQFWLRQATRWHLSLNWYQYLARKIFTLPFNQGEQMAPRSVNCVHPFNKAPSAGSFYTQWKEQWQQRKEDRERKGK